MIGYLKGTAHSGGIIVDGAGVGWKVTTCEPLTAGESVEMLVTTIVREDAILLYGFADEASQELFSALTRVSGVGPSIAMSLLAGLSVDGISQAVARKDAAALSKVRGVGGKLAEKIVTLIALPASANSSTTRGGKPDAGEDTVVLALVSLGWDLAAARTATAAARVEHDDDALVLRAALRS